MATLPSTLNPATLAVEEDSYARSYKKVHAFGCARCQDPERVDFAGGSFTDLAQMLSGLATDADDAETDAEVSDVLLPCARKALFS